MTLFDLGYNQEWENYRIGQNLEEFAPGRVIAEHKERYSVLTESQVYEAEILGNLRFGAKSRADFPAVGDWVAIQVFDSDFAIIHKIFPRKTVIKRKAAGTKSDEQIIAANVDYAFIVQAADRDFNINRLERYLAISSDADINPVIILTKTDLISGDKLLELKNKIAGRIKNVPVIAISNRIKSGYEEIKAVFEKGKTYCFLGSSGVGKSTLINNLSGKELMKTNSISVSTNKGRHVTTHRELIVLGNGAIVIDNPGMREVGIAGSSGMLEDVFDEIAALSKECRYADCTHVHEDGCAVIAAVESGKISELSYRNYLKMLKESIYFQSGIAEKRKNEKKLAKVVREYKKQKKRNKL